MSLILHNASFGKTTRNFEHHIDVYMWDSCEDISEVQSMEQTANIYFGQKIYLAVRTIEE